MLKDPVCKALRTVAFARSWVAGLWTDGAGREGCRGADCLRRQTFLEGAGREVFWVDRSNGRGERVAEG